MLRFQIALQAAQAHFASAVLRYVYIHIDIDIDLDLDENRYIAIDENTHANIHVSIDINANCRQLRQPIVLRCTNECTWAFALDDISEKKTWLFSEPSKKSKNM